MSAEKTATRFSSRTAKGRCRRTATATPAVFTRSTSGIVASARDILSAAIVLFGSIDGVSTGPSECIRGIFFSNRGGRALSSLLASLRLTPSNSGILSLPTLSRIGREAMQCPSAEHSRFAFGWSAAHPNTSRFFWPLIPGLNSLGTFFGYGITPPISLRIMRPGT